MNQKTRLTEEDKAKPTQLLEGTSGERRGQGDGVTRGNRRGQGDKVMG